MRGGFSDPTRLAEAHRQFQRELDEQVRLSEAALVHVVKHGVFKSMKKGAHLVPIDEGNLRKTAYMAWGSGAAAGNPTFFSKRPGKAGRLKSDHASRVATAVGRSGRRGLSTFLVELGYSAYYALIVHEDLYSGTRHKKHKPFFLSHALNENAPKITEQMREYWKRHKRRSS